MEEWETLRWDHDAEEANRIAIKMERDHLAQCLSQLQQEFDEFCRVMVLPTPRTQSSGPILQQIQLYPQLPAHSQLPLATNPLDHISPSNHTKMILAQP